MADKEERILISGLRKYKGDAYKLTMFGDKDVVPVERVWQMCMTRQEAINKIGVALCVANGNVDCDECIYRGTDNCKTQLKNWYLKDAEVALDALLGDK